MRPAPVKIIRHHAPSSFKEDLYHSLLQLSWPKTLLLIIFTYLCVNLFFALLYWLSPGCLINWDNSFKGAFYFSVQTLGTIGYGSTSPLTDYANILVTIEAILGVMIIALITGVFFAKFATPFARIFFTDSLVINLYEGVPTLMFRTINLRDNSLIDAKVSFLVLKEMRSQEGTVMRRFLDLNLVRSYVPLFTMSLTFMHPIDEKSPLYGLSPQEIQQASFEFFVTIIGIDGTFGQTIHASKIYKTSQILWDRPFEDIVEVGEDGTRHIYFNKFQKFKS
ncbi:MAG: ion channel [Proteobacteria bacterium]|nr:ion channel [Pseudomonadota bacterium]